MSAPLTKQRLAELDGLRGFALVMILAFHSIYQEGEFPAGSFLAWLQRSVGLDWTALDLFFVLSGFLIGGILMDSRESPNYFKTFYARRVYRIVPVYYAWVLLYIVLIGFAGNQVTRLSNSGIRPPLTLAVISYFLFLQNSFTMDLFGFAGAWFGHLWSLAVEEQFYLVAPLVVRLARPKTLKWILSAVVILAVAARLYLRLMVHEAPTLITTRTVCRMDALAIGMLAACLYRSEAGSRWLAENLRALRALLAFAFAGVLWLFLYSYGSVTPAMQTFGFTWMAFFYAAVLLLVVQNRTGWLAGFLRNPILRELGTVSYCVYLIHVVVNVSLHAVILHHAPRISTISGTFVTVLGICLTYGIAKLSWLYFEGPLQRRGHAYKY